MHSTNNIFQSLLLCWEVVHTLEIWHWTNRQSPCPHRTYSLMREDCLMAFSIIYPFRSCTTDKGSDCFEIWCRLTRWLRIYWESETHFGGWQGGVCFVNEFFLNTCSSFFFFFLQEQLLVNNLPANYESGMKEAVEILTRME